MGYLVISYKDNLDIIDRQEFDTLDKVEEYIETKGQYEIYEVT